MARSRRSRRWSAHYRGDIRKKFRIRKVEGNEVDLLHDLMISLSPAARAACVRARGTWPCIDCRETQSSQPVSYRIPNFSVRIYGPAAMAGGKVNALLSENRTDMRDGIDAAGRSRSPAAASHPYSSLRRVPSQHLFHGMSTIYSSWQNSRRIQCRFGFSAFRARRCGEDSRSRGPASPPAPAKRHVTGIVPTEALAHH